MSAGKFPALADAIGEALAAWAAAELDDPWDVDECPRALAAWTADLSYALRRSAGRLEVTALPASVPEAIRDAAGMAGVSAGEVEHLAGFSLMHGYT